MLIRFLPPQISFVRHRVQSAYDRSFSTLKADKKLRWLPHLGNVNMTIELKDRSITVDATPVQAAVIELFNKQGELYSSSPSDPSAFTEYLANVL
jgi:anaphase-promoting complex subunit 2